jgi:ABC-2 type transport system ATP-binding protein
VTEFALETEALTKRFGGTTAVDGLSFSVRRGEFFCIVGPDGAGKTTTIRLLSGIARPTSGRARIFGFDLVGEQEEVKKRLGYFSQKFTLYNDLTVDENIEFFAEIHGVRDFQKRRDELLAFTRLAPFRRRLAENLSGGMKQKLSLACTLVHTPDLLLLDEPTTGVDPVSRRDFWKILLGLLQNGMTIVMTTPYLDEAERGSRVALMHLGRFMVVDTPANVKATMKEPILELVCSDNRRALAALRKLAGTVDVQAFGDRIHLIVRDPDRDIDAALRRLAEENIQVIHRRRVPPSLENVFIALTNPSSPAEARRA